MIANSWRGAVAPFNPNPRWPTGYFQVVEELGVEEQRYPFYAHCVRKWSGFALASSASLARALAARLPLRRNAILPDRRFMYPSPWDGITELGCSQHEFSYVPRLSQSSPRTHLSAESFSFMVMLGRSYHVTLSNLTQHKRFEKSSAFSNPSSPHCYVPHWSKPKTAIKIRSIRFQLHHIFHRCFSEC